MTIYRDSSSLKLLLGVSGLLCTTCCGRQEDMCCPGWGPGNTPTVYNVTISGVQDCPVAGATTVNGTWPCTLVECSDFEGEEFGCSWKYEDGSVKVELVRIRLRSLNTDVDVTANFKDGINWRSAFDAKDRYTWTTGQCPSGDNNWVNCAPPRYGKFGSYTAEPADGNCDP